MILPSTWSRVLDFFGMPLVIEPSPGQHSGDAGRLPIRQFDERIGLTRAFAGALDDKEVEQWRQQAFDWLRADLAWWSKAVETAGTRERAVIAQTMRHWQSDPDLAGVRERTALARLRQLQREQWLNLWADVRALLARAVDQKFFN